MDSKLVENVTPSSVTLATFNQPESELMLSAGDKERSSTEEDVIAGSSKGQSKHLTSLPSSCTSYGVSGLCDVSDRDSEGLQVKKQPPVIENVPDGETGDQKSET